LYVGIMIDLLILRWRVPNESSQRLHHSIFIARYMRKQDVVMLAARERPKRTQCGIGEDV